MLALVTFVDTVVLGEGGDRSWHGEPVLWTSLAVMAVLVPRLLVLSRRASAGVPGTASQGTIALAVLFGVAIPGMDSIVVLWPAALVGLLLLVSLWRSLRREERGPRSY